MNNKVLGTTFMAVGATAFLIFGGVNAGAMAIDTWLFPKEQFGDNTYIGTTNVSNMEVASAMSQFDGVADSWRETAELTVTYQDATAVYPLDDVEILLEQTAERAKSGMQNAFVFQLQDRVTERFLAEEFSLAELSKAETERINDELEQALQSGLEKTHVILGTDALAVNREIVSEASYPLESNSEGLMEMMASLNEVQIAPGAKFSFLDFISELDNVQVTDEELTGVASAIYSAVLQTNFSINERSIGTVLPEDDQAGYEAAINRNLSIDLVFTNPNASSFALETSASGNSVKATISGLPLVYNYNINTDDSETVNPRLIKQYSAFVARGTTSVEEPGSEGARIQVIRVIASETEELTVETVSKDFYPPVNRVEIHPLIGEPENESPTDTNNSGDSDNTGSAAGAANDSTEDDSLAGSTTDEGAMDSEGTDASEDKEKQGNSGSAEAGKNAETDEPIYDKAGNLVKP